MIDYLRDFPELSADSVKQTLTNETANQLLNYPIESIIQSEFPWQTPLDLENGRPTELFFFGNPLHRNLWDRPLLRIWDNNSGSQPEDGRMLARAPRLPLKTIESRVESLALHAYHRNWDIDTPYISFKTQPHEIWELATKRTEIRGPQNLTLINPRVRFHLGLPILHYHTEMLRYGVEDPYGRAYRYYLDHYLCPWEVTKEEIVDTALWDEVSCYPDWYEGGVMPAFENHWEQYVQSHGVRLNTFERCTTV